MWGFHNQLRRFSFILGAWGIGIGLLGWLGDLVWGIAANGEDPIIQTVEISADFPIYNPASISDTSQTVYFNNLTTGILTVSLAISGTPPLTLTSFSAFHQDSIFTSTQAVSWFVPITYGVAVTEGSYVGVHYTVINTDGITATAVLSYQQDITAPIVVITSPQSVLSLTAGSELTLTGTAVDEGAGLAELVVIINEVPLTVTQILTTWQGGWDVPLANRLAFTITAIVTDRLTITGAAVSPPFLLDNVLPTVTITTPLQTTNHSFTVTWQGNDASNPLATHPFTVQYRRDDDPPNTWAEWFTRTNLTEAFFATAEPGYSYSFRATAIDQAGNSSPWQTVTTQVDFYQTYLPLLVKPSLSGSLQISSARSHDITVFTPNVTLSLGVSQQPAEMKVWNGTTNEEPTGGWVPFSTNYSWVLLNSGENGIRQVNVRFREVGGTGESDIITAKVYYLQNGDFAEGATGWTVADHGLTFSVLNGNLRLGSNGYDCLNMPFGVWAEASLTLNAPSESGFVLNFQYTIYTHDQLPDPDITIYDAFEIYLNNSFYLRDGNPDMPLSCSTLRVLPRQKTAELNTYQGQPLSVRFENHSRFDQFYNTYTDIEEVWVSLETDS